MAEAEKSDAVKKEKKKPAFQLAVDAFESMSKEWGEETAKLFEMDFKNDIQLEWKILQDDNHLEAADNPMVYLEELQFKKDVDFVN